jgi:hypothetical protein
MCAGVGLFSVFSGFLAAWFLDPESRGDQSQIDGLKAEIEALRQAVENLRK